MAIGYPEPIDAATKLSLTNNERDLFRGNMNKDNRVLGLIQRGMDDIIFPKVSNAQFQKKLGTLLKPVIRVYPK